jgi:MSHA biogenesis protein MshJ
MIALQGMLARTRPLIERLDALTLRERVIIFGAGVALVYIAWQTLLMDPLAVRAKSAQQHLTDVRQQAAVIDQIGTASSQDPSVAAALRNRALVEHLTALDHEINSAAQGYVAPQRMNELLRALLAEQHGLKLISLTNLTVESLSRPDGAKVDGNADNTIAAGDRGPFLHPVEIVVEGDYASVVTYLRAVEGMPWRIHWRRLELTAGPYPVNRVKLVIGALSLSPDWMSV